MISTTVEYHETRRGSMWCCLDNIGKASQRRLTFLSTEAVHQKGKREKEIQGIEKKCSKFRNLTQQVSTEIQYITQWLFISKFTLRETLLKMRQGNKKCNRLISYVMSPNRNSCYKNCLYQSRLATCIQWGFCQNSLLGDHLHNRQKNDWE